MVATQTPSSQSNPTVTPVRFRGRPEHFEALESRTLLSSTLFVSPGAPDATHFQTLQAALIVAATGDTIVLQSGFSPGSFITTSLTQTATAGSSIIRTAAALSAGQVVSVGNNTGGDIRERVLVTSVTPTGTGDYLATLASPLLLSHTGSVVDADNAGLGPTIGLAVGITLTADNGVLLPFDLEIWDSPASAMITLSNLNMGTHGLALHGDGTTVRDSVLGSVAVQAGSQANVFLHNTFTVTNGDGLNLEHANGTILDGNTFHVTSDYAFALVVHNSANVLITGNHIFTGAGGTGIYVSVDDSQTTTADIRGNTIQTLDGFGIYVAKMETTSTMQARIEGNVLSANAIGVFVLGDSVTAGSVDLGGGSTVFGTSLGGNDFSGFTTSDDSHFAIGLFNTSAGYALPADANVWGVADPTTVVADAVHTPAAFGTGIIVTAPTVEQETLTATAEDQSAVETGISSGVVATFTTNLQRTAADFIANIDWGDGQTSQGTVIANSDGTFSVLGTHTWDSAGSFNITVAIVGPTGASVSASASADIAARTLSVEGVNFSSSKNKKFSGTVAKFTDNLGGTTAASYTASVAWSDGMVTAATITKNADGTFSIATSRSFSRAGVIVASVSVGTTDGLFYATANLTATITDGIGKNCHKDFRRVIIFIRKFLANHGHTHKPQFVFRPIFHGHHGCHR